MGLFDHFKNSELAKARKESDRNPNPITIESYCRALISAANLDEALAQATAGLDRFPDSDRLIGVVRYVKKNQLGPRVAELKEKVRTSPSPMLYRQLAELYRDIGDDQRALDTCMEVRERYPKDENTFLVMGEIYHERYQNSHLASDGKLAVANLKRACELNRNNYNALLKLAQLYISVGQFKQTVPFLRNIINFAPADKRVKALLSRSQELAERQTDIEDLDMLLRTVEERGAPMHRVIYTVDGSADIQVAEGSRVVAGADRREITRQIEIVDLEHTFSGVIAYDRELQPLASKFGDGTIGEARVAAVQGIVDVLVKQSPSLSMGGFREGRIETKETSMFLVSFADGYLYLSTRPHARQESIEQQISELIGKVTS